MAVVGGLFLLISSSTFAATEDDGGITPPRLSLLEREVSFWRPGNTDWQAAHINTPLAAGDALAAGPDGRFEIQVAAQAFLRADRGTQVQLDANSRNSLRFKLTSGVASLDVRAMPPHLSIEIGTPSAAFSITQAGYYRIDVTDERTHCITRDGSLTLTTAVGETRSIGPDSDVRVDDSGLVVGGASARADAWDEWNRSRSDEQLGVTSRRYLSQDVYGAGDLDHYGRWQVVPTYGRVWLPPVSASWVPYSTGNWMWDGYYGWSWVDSAPWGWAPFHYGRWVYVNSYWAWAPGPIVVQAAYAPALVAFFGGSGWGVGVSIGIPAISWVALGWGEPCTPWWGPVGFYGHPWWGGWGGPHVVNQTYVNNYYNNTVNIYEHGRDGRGIVAVDRSRFGASPVDRARLARFEADRLGRSDELLPRRPANVNQLPQRSQPIMQDAVLTRPVVGARPSAPHEPFNAPQQSAGKFAAPESYSRQRPGGASPGSAATSTSASAPSRGQVETRGPRRPAGTSPSSPPPVQSGSVDRTTPRDAQRDWDRWRSTSAPHSGPGSGSAPSSRTQPGPRRPAQGAEAPVEPLWQGATQQPGRGPSSGSYSVITRPEQPAARQPPGPGSISAGGDRASTETSAWDRAGFPSHATSPHVSNPPPAPHVSAPTSGSARSSAWNEMDRAPRRPMSQPAAIAPAPQAAPAPAPRFESPSRGGGWSASPHQASPPSMPSHVQSSAPAAPAHHSGGGSAPSGSSGGGHHGPHR